MTASANNKWPPRDLIRLWPWLLPFEFIILMVLTLLGAIASTTPQLIIILEAYGAAWAAFLVTRHFIGFTTAHRVGFSSAILFGTASFLWPHPHLWMLIFFIAASVAIFSSRKSKKITCYTLVLTLDVAAHIFMSSKVANSEADLSPRGGQRTKR